MTKFVHKFIHSFFPSKINQRKLLASLAQLDLAVELLERGLTDEKEELKRIIAAEIKARYLMTRNVFLV